MQRSKRFKKTRLLEWVGALGVGSMLFQGQCMIDPDIGLRALISVGTDTAIFFLENLANGI
ncbi:MAG: hypothetical protein ACYTHJ_17530 [Planctomycetota bacterium]